MWDKLASERHAAATNPNSSIQIKLREYKRRLKTLWASFVPLKVSYQNFKVEYHVFFSCKNVFHSEIYDIL